MSSLVGRSACQSGDRCVAMPKQDRMRQLGCLRLLSGSSGRPESSSRGRASPVPDRAVLAQHEQLELVLALEHDAHRREGRALQVGPVAPLLAVARHVAYRHPPTWKGRSGQASSRARAAAEMTSELAVGGESASTTAATVPVLFPHLLKSARSSPTPNASSRPDSRATACGIDETLPSSAPSPAGVLAPCPVLELVVGADREDVHASRAGHTCGALIMS